MASVQAQTKPLMTGIWDTSFSYVHLTLGNQLIRSSDNDSTGFWPPGSLHTLGADGHI